MIINPTKNKQNATLCQYFQASTAESKCMYNTANFYIRNTMTGLKNSPEEHMHSEIEVLHYVFTGIQRYNDIKIKEIETLKLRIVGGLNSERIMLDILFKKLIQYPTREKWFLSYETRSTWLKSCEVHSIKHKNMKNIAIILLILLLSFFIPLFFIYC